MKGDEQPLFTYLLRQGDRALVLSQRLSQWLTCAHELEEEMALGNIALDLLGQARTLYTYAGEVEGEGRSEDDLAYFRPDREFLNPLLVEQPNGDFAVTMMRQFLHDAWARPTWAALCRSSDSTLAGLAGKAVKETSYHLRHARSWVIRLGDGTDDSRLRMQSAASKLWKFKDELFEVDAVEEQLIRSGIAVMDGVRESWIATVEETFRTATLDVPEDGVPSRGGRDGQHGEHFSYLLGEMQVVARAHPGARW